MLKRLQQSLSWSWFLERTALVCSAGQKAPAHVLLTPHALLALGLQGPMWMRQSSMRQPCTTLLRWRMLTSSRCLLSLEATSMRGTTGGRSHPTTLGVVVRQPSALSSMKVRPNASPCCGPLNDVVYSITAWETVRQEALSWQHIRSLMSK